MIQSKNNILSPLMFSTIKNAVFDPGTPWYSLTTDYYNIATPDNYSHSWAHVAYGAEGSLSHIGDMLLMTALAALDNAGEIVNQIIRIRLGMHTISPVIRVGSPHVDYNIPHKVALIYLNDSDGDTVIFNEKYDPESNADTYGYFMDQYKGSVSVAATSTPEANKIILFDGLHYHSSSSPTKVAKRVVININYT